jgi:hypothetical protein
MRNSYKILAEKSKKKKKKLEDLQVLCEGTLKKYDCKVQTCLRTYQTDDNGYNHAVMNCRQGLASKLFNNAVSSTAVT